MAITLICPRCTHKQSIDDDQAGKEVPCKICFHELKAAAPAKSKSSTQVTNKPHPSKASVAAKAESKLAAADDDDMQTGAIQTGPPPVKGKTSSAGRKKVDDDPKPSRKPKPQSSSGMLWVTLAGGAVVLLLMLVCAGGVGALFLFRSKDPAAEPIAHGPPPEEPAPPAIVNPPPPEPFRPNPFPPAANPFAPPPPPLNPDDPNEITRVLQFLKGTPQERSLAFTWLDRANLNHPRRAEIARALEPMVDEPGRNPFDNTFINIYFRWATKDNLPSLVRLAEGGGLRDERREKAMQTLARLKEPAGADVIARRLGNFFDGKVAASALSDMGPVAQPVVLKYFNQPDQNARNAARQLIKDYNTPANVIIAQCIADLAAEPARRGAALQWFAQAPADGEQKLAVSKALNASITDENSVRNRDLMTALEKWGTAENLPALMKFYNHQHPWTREPIRKLVQSLNPPAQVMIAQCLTDLDAFEPSRRGGALDWFAQSPADPQRRAEVARALNKAIENENSFNNGNLGKALENWGTSENVPKLVPILDGARLRRGDVVRALAKIRDPNGLEAVARRLNNFFDGAEVRQALKEAGPLGEPAVVKVMTTTMDGNTRLACVRFLGEIGTRSSLFALKQTADRFPQDRNLANTVGVAMIAINMRP